MLSFTVISECSKLHVDQSNFRRHVENYLCHSKHIWVYLIPHSLNILQTNIVQLITNYLLYIPDSFSIHNVKTRHVPDDYHPDPSPEVVPVYAKIDLTTLTTPCCVPWFPGIYVILQLF